MKKLFFFSTIFLSLFIIVNSCSDSGTESTPIYQLETAAEPSQAGTVSPSSGEYDEGEAAEISASANEGWIFEKWQGGHTGTSNPESVTMNQDKQVTALFVKIEHALNKEVQGEGDIYERIIQAKTTTHEPGTVVEVIAVPDEGWKFSHWETDLDGSENPVTLTMDGEKTVTAVFERRDYELTIDIEGEGAVAEEVVQAKTTEYPFETLVELTANPATGWEFDRWEGDLQGNENPAQVEIRDAKQVKAVFVRQIFEVNTTVEGDGSVNRELISGTESEAGYEYDSVVQLTADPEVGWEFAGWTGDIESTENPISVTADTTKEIAAQFERIEYSVEILTDGEGTVSLEQLSGDEAVNGYYYGSEIELTATPAEEWLFVNWEGDTTSEVNPLTLTIEDNVSLSAIFARDEYTIDITLDGEGEVVTELLSGEQTATGYKYGAEVRLTVNPTDGWNFVHWDGDLGGTDNPIDIVMDQHYVATGVMDNSPFVGGNGSSLYPYQINTLEQLEEVRYYASSHFVQISDIDASATANWNNGNGFLPIGDETFKFTGVYDGGNYNISNLNIKPQSFRQVNGMFGYIEDAVLKNMNLIDINVETCCVGGLVFSGFNSEINNIYVSGQMKGGNTIGGIMNENRGGSIINSSTNIIFEAGSRVGGLVVSNSGNIENSYTSGKMNPNTTGWGEYAGGIAGYNSGMIKNSYSVMVMTNDGINNGGLVGNNSGTIEASYFKGNVSGDTKVGGLVSENHGLIIDSYVFGSVAGESEIGGIAGTNSGEIINSYSKCEISGAKDVGGVIGVNGATIESSYWDTEATFQIDGVGRGNSDGITGLTTASMTGTTAEENMSEFDWVNIWITTDSYPIFRWQQENN